jgi:hypothetical protein
MCPLVLMNAQKVPQFIGTDLESDKSYMCARASARIMKRYESGYAVDNIVVSLGE